MDIEKINSIIDLFKSSGLDEMSLELKDFKIMMKNNKLEYVTSDITKNSDVKGLITDDEKNTNGEWVKAPFVGTFYSSASENDKPYVEVGQKVTKGDVLCILEAMKVMNEIKSDRDGTILEIKAKNGNMVEFDEELILIGE